jgi:putative acetyltransferase
VSDAPLAIREEAAGDAADVRKLLVSAFGGPAEADLVDRLRRDGDLILALLATDARRDIVGHVAFSRLRIEVAFSRLRIESVGHAAPAVALAPLAVADTQRRRGIGAALVRAGLDRLAAQGETLMFVLGDPAYYRRFGFATETAERFACVYAGPHFMALRLSDHAPGAGTIRYPAAFDELA